MISFNNVVKKFNNAIALDNISFNINNGSITGFLGPNGAGKTTAMRIITSYIQPDSGEVNINNFSPINDSLKSRKIIGYLPENVPLYKEMRVYEYLNYRAKLKKIKNRKTRIKEVCELCSIEDVYNRIIGQLSKGYTQRIGIADVLLSKPEILILDEPTNGLDPNQVIHFRKLLTELAENQTVILSTHILSEVEAVCKDVIIINKGKVIAQDTVDKLKMIKSGEIKYSLTIKFDKDDINSVEDKICALENVNSFIRKSSSENIYNYELIIDTEECLDKLFKLLMSENCFIRELYKDKSSLENIFVKLTRETENKNETDPDNVIEPEIELESIEKEI